MTQYRAPLVVSQRLAVLLLSAMSVAWPQPGGAQQPNATAADSAAALPWGEAVDGLQLQLETGRNTESLIATQSMLYLAIRARNASSTPIYVDFDEFAEATYDFEYEIDGVWYAFERRAPVRTTLTASREGRDPALSVIEAIAPGSSRYAMLTVPLIYGLFATTSDGTGARFEATPGPHVVRVRPGPSALQGREAPVSNAVTVNVQVPLAARAGEPSVSFASAAATGLDAFRFASGPADALELIRSVLARPPSPPQIARLLAADTVEILEPLPFYELVLPRAVNVADPPLPTRSGAYHYLARAGGRIVNTIALADYPSGSALSWIGSEGTSRSRFEALQALARMVAVRGGHYEPRLLRINGVRGMGSFQVIWLHSSQGLPDLFYRFPDPDFRGTTSVELDRVYNAQELLTAARALPVTPKHDERWAAATATVCAQGERGTFGGGLVYDAARVEIGLNDAKDGVVWYVYFPEQIRDTVGSHMGAAFFVDEADGTCRRATLGG